MFWYQAPLTRPLEPLEVASRLLDNALSWKIKENHAFSTNFDDFHWFSLIFKNFHWYPLILKDFQEFPLVSMIFCKLLRSSRPARATFRGRPMPKRMSKHALLVPTTTQYIVQPLSESTAPHRPPTGPVSKKPHVLL